MKAATLSGFSKIDMWPVGSESGPLRVLRREANRLGSGLEARMPALEITAPVPQHMLAALERLGYDPDRSSALKEGVPS